mmetsp:Transcript_15898/g.47829  ORF Transcript_15898/g.47829 Transcript_15898/m.47829 type:complete len:220 (-) Transcript_15898:422-1081(-)
MGATMASCFSGGTGFLEPLAPMKPAENCEMGHDIGGSMGNAGDWDCSSQPLSTIAVSASDRQPPASLHQNHELQVRAAVHCSAQAPADSATFSDPDVTTRILRVMPPLATSQPSGNQSAFSWALIFRFLNKLSGFSPKICSASASFSVSDGAPLNFSTNSCRPMCLSRPGSDNLSEYSGMCCHRSPALSPSWLQLTTIRPTACATIYIAQTRRAPPRMM